MEIKLYICVYKWELYGIKRLTAHFNENENIKDWYFNTTNVLFIESNLSATKLRASIKEIIGDVRMFVTEVSSTNTSCRQPVSHLNKMRNYLDSNRFMLE